MQQKLLYQHYVKYTDYSNDRTAVFSKQYCCPNVNPQAFDRHPVVSHYLSRDCMKSIK